MSLAAEALERHLTGDVEPEESPSDDDGTPVPSASREALREAWEASKADNFEGFADAIEALVDIKMAER